MMDSKDLIQKYLEAETSVAQERELAKADKTVAALSESLAIEPLSPLPDATGEFDRIVRGARIRTVRRCAFAFSGVAAILVAVFFLTRTTDIDMPTSQDSMEMIQQLQLISTLDPANADSYEFKPVGDGFIMTARFDDGTTASFLLTPMDDGNSFHLVAFNK